MSDLPEYDDSWKDRLADRCSDISDWVRKNDKKVILAVVILFIVGLFLANPEKEEIIVDKQTQCPTDTRHIRAYALVLLDGTDNIVGEYAQSLHKEVMALARALPQYGKISLHDVATGKKRLFMRCAPKSPDDFERLNESESILKNAYEKKYLAKVKVAVQAFLDDKSRDQSVSPLLYNIGDVTALSDFQATDNRSFYIFSDMLENFDGYSHYRNMTPKEFQWLRKQSQYQKPKLDEVTVQVFYLLRNISKRYQSDNHRLFWDNYFNDAGTNSVKWTDVNLPGEALSWPSSATPLPPPPAPKPAPKPTLKPAPKPAPKPALKPALSGKCDSAMAGQYRNSITQSSGKNIAALYCLAKLCAEGSIPGKESDDILEMMKTGAYLNGDVSPEFRGFVGELYFHGLCGIKRSRADAYVLLLCAGEKGTARLHKLQKRLSDDNGLISGENNLNYLRGKKRCL